MKIRATEAIWDLFRLTSAGFQSMKTNDEDGPVGTLSRGLHVLSCIASIGKRTALTKIARAANLNLATTYRLVMKLVELGYLERDEDGLVSLGSSVLNLGFSYLASLDVRAHALPELQRLRTDLDCTVSLCILDGVDIVYVERLASLSPQPSVQRAIGSRLPVQITAAGKAIVAHLPLAEQQLILDRIRYEAIAPQTVRRPRRAREGTANGETTWLRRCRSGKCPRIPGGRRANFRPHRPRRRRRCRRLGSRSIREPEPSAGRGSSARCADRSGDIAPSWREVEAIVMERRFRIVANRQS